MGHKNLHFRREKSPEMWEETQKDSSLEAQGKENKRSRGETRNGAKRIKALSVYD